jgi:hypothetical protein
VTSPGTARPIDAELEPAPATATDVLTVPTALATATGSMLVDELATALNWTLDRV